MWEAVNGNQPLNALFVAAVHPNYRPDECECMLQKRFLFSLHYTIQPLPLHCDAGKEVHLPGRLEQHQGPNAKP